jgi:hypothetical protein
LFFSVYNSEVEGFYSEIDNIKSTHEIIERCLYKYNDSNERQHINLILFQELNKTVIKLRRVLDSSNGHIMIIALKG